ncbi:helix-turn-helix transcriptional regulator [Burkholderia sp. 3C]
MACISLDDGSVANDANDANDANAANGANGANAANAAFADWPAPSGAPIARRGLGALAQPCLTTAQHTPRFVFQEATAVLIVSGRLDLDDGLTRMTIDAPASLLLVEAGIGVDLEKTPGGAARCFRSVFLTFSAALLDAFERGRPGASADAAHDAAFRSIRLDDDLAASLRQVAGSMTNAALSDERLRYRLLDLLAALDERGFRFRRIDRHSTAAQVRTLIGDAPARHWTAHEAGKALAMSPATLRRRLAAENARFEDLLIEVRMHHAMLLVQTTTWGVARIAEACGYQSRARFSQRFHARFGCLPSVVR